MRIRPVAALAVVAAAALLAGCTDSDGLVSQYRAGDTKNYVSGNGAVSEFPAAHRGDPVVFTTRDLQGHTVTAEQFRGKALVLNFWFAGCVPCRVEAADLNDVSTRQRDHAAFLGVNVRDSAGTAESFVRRHDVAYDTVLDVDGAPVQLAFSGSAAPNATPSTIVLDRRGRVSARILGPVDASVLETLVRDADR